MGTTSWTAWRFRSVHTDEVRAEIRCNKERCNNDDQHHNSVVEQACAAVRRDAPHGANDEPEVWDGRRVRERGEAFLRDGLLRSHCVAAVRDADGEMAAFTEMLVAPEHPDWGFQELTAVTRAHRGHRLGLLVKAAMLEWLTEQEPALARVSTYNAAVNRHMIAINEELGFEVSGPPYQDIEFRVADVTGAAGA